MDKTTAKNVGMLALLLALGLPTFSKQPVEKSDGYTLCREPCDQVEWDSKRGECESTRDGSSCMDDCCCFVASASGLTQEQIERLRALRDELNRSVPGFRVIISDTYPRWGPEVANTLRAVPVLKEMAHAALSVLANGPARYIKEGKEGSTQLHQQERTWRTIAPPIHGYGLPGVYRK